MVESSRNAGESELRPDTLELNLSPDAFHMWAGDFLQAARDFQHPERFSPVPLFLICRAIELHLKSRLLVRWAQEEVKRKIGHSILKAYKALERSEQILTQEEVTVLRTADKFYPKKLFEYWSPAKALGGYSRFPSVHALESIAAKLIDKGA